MSVSSGKLRGSWGGRQGMKGGNLFMRNRFKLIAAAVIMIFTIVAPGGAQAQPVVLNQVEVQENKGDVQILFSTSKSIPIECYDLSSPPQVVIDFMGEIYTNRPEIFTVDKGSIRQVRTVKGTKSSDGLGEDYYSVDFLIVDLKETTRYDFSQGLTTAVLAVSKPGSGRMRAEVSEEKSALVFPSVLPETPVEKKSVAVKPAALPEPGKTESVRAEAPPRSNVEVVEPTAEKARDKSEKGSGLKQGIKSVGAGIGSFGRGIKNILTPGPAVKPSGQEMARTEPDVRESARSQRIEVVSQAKERPTGKFRGKKTESKSAPRTLSEFEKQVEDARIQLKQAEADLAKAEEGVKSAKQSLQDREELNDQFADRVLEKQEKLQEDRKVLETDAGLVKLAKERANEAWNDYVQAKEKLSLVVSGQADTVGVQEDFDEKKMALEKAIQNAEDEKKAYDDKVKAYETAVDELEKMISEGRDPEKQIQQAKEEVNVAQQRLRETEQVKKEAEIRLAAAEQDLNQYQLEQAERAFKQSLDKLDIKQVEEAKPVLQPEDKQAQWLEAEARAREEAMARLQKTAAEPEEDVIPKRRKATSFDATVPVTQVTAAEPLTAAIELRNAGLEMHRVGRIDSALKYYQQSLMVDPKYYTVHNDLGILYEQKGLDEKAKMEYLAALKANPKYAKAHSNLALLYEKTGDFDKAYYHWKQRVVLGDSNDPWTKKAEQKLTEIEQRR